MPHSVTLAASALLLIIVGGGAEAQGRAEVARRFGEAVSAEIPDALDAGRVPGAAVALVGSGGVLWSGGFGRVARGDSRSVDADTLFSIQSMTKTLTAVTVLSAVESGRVSLDAPLSTLLPGFTVRTRYAAKPEDRITLRHLLAHRAGFTQAPAVGHMAQSRWADLESMLASASNTWLRRPVDARYLYSNLGIDLAALVLQRAEERPFEEIAAARVLTPLGMRRSTFSASTVRADPNHATGFVAGIEGALPDTSFLASGGLFTSANELSRFVAMQLGGGALDGTRVLSEAGVREMGRIASPVSDFQESGYGLGVGVTRGEGGRVLRLGHQGGGYGFESAMRWVPEAQLGLVVLQNSRGDSSVLDVAGRHFVEALRALAPGHVAAWDWKAPVLECAAPDAAREDAHRGTYVGRTRHVRVERRGGVFGIEDGSFVPLCFVAGSGEVAVRPGTGNAYRLELDDAGRPLAVVGLNSGAVYLFNDGPGSSPAPGVEIPDILLGTYERRQYGQLSGYIALREHDGHFYFGEQRLVDTVAPRTWVASNGEVLDLGGLVMPGASTWAAGPIERIADPATLSQRAGLVAAARRVLALLEAGDRDKLAALYASDDVGPDDLAKVLSLWREATDRGGGNPRLAGGTVLRSDDLVVLDATVELASARTGLQIVLAARPARTGRLRGVHVRRPLAVWRPPTLE